LQVFLALTVHLAEQVFQLSLPTVVVVVEQVQITLQPLQAEVVEVVAVMDQLAATPVVPQHQEQAELQDMDLQVAPQAVVETIQAEVVAEQAEQAVRLLHLHHLAEMVAQE
jgi:hypothetical protein